MSGRGKGLGALPHRELKKLARENGVPLSGTAAELAERLEKALPATLKSESASAFVETKRAFSYRYYRIKRGGAKISEITKKVGHRDAEKDPFRSMLRPELSDAPKVYQARVTPDDCLYLHIAFYGDTRTVQDGWDDVEVTPPIVAVVAIREDEGILEVRGRWEKVAVIEEWVEETLGVKIEHLKFTNAELQRMKKVLKAKLATQTIRPNAGGIASIRIATSGPDVDLDENRDGQEVNALFSQVGFQRRNPGFIYNPSRVRVRANEKEGSFYIPKHATEAEVRVLRHAFLVTKGVMKKKDFKLPEPPASGDGKPARRLRLVTPATLENKVDKLDNLTASQRRTVIRVLRSLQVDQQARIFPGLWELWLPDLDGEYVANQLSQAGVLEKVKEAQCPKCDFTGPADGYPAECPDCEADITEPTIYYRVRGFLEPRVAEDDVFTPDNRKMAELYREVTRTRAPKNHAKNDEKKKALEGLSEHLFVSLAGFRCTGQNVRTSEAEVDRVFRNENTTHALLQKMGLNVRVECKNTKGAVSAAEFGTFVDVLRAANAPFGVYVSMKGFTGMSGTRGRKTVKLSDAVQKARDAHMEGHTVLMLDGADVEDVVQGRQSLVSVLWKAYELVTNL